MATFRVGTVFETNTGLYFIEVYYLEDSTKPFVISKPIYRSHDQAAEDAFRIFREGLSDQPQKAAPMTKYRNTLNEINGYKLVEVVKVDAEENITIIGYAILDPDGNELSQFSTYKQALEELEQHTNDSKPSSPRPF